MIYDHYKRNFYWLVLYLRSAFKQREANAVLVKIEIDFPLVHLLDIYKRPYLHPGASVHRL